jgi:hypothetical protein
MNSDHAERRTLGVLHLRSERFLLVPRGSDVAGEHLSFPDRERARLFLASLAAEPGNREVLRAAVERMRGVPSGFGGRPDEGEWAPLTEALARHSLEAVRLIVHPISPIEITTTGKLTLSEVSWGETSGIYPSSQNVTKPDRWDAAKLVELLKARSALTDVATRNSHVRKAKPGLGYIDQLMRPYHCLENFPQHDPEIDVDVKWFYLSAALDKPLSHPGTSGTVIVKTYGPFFNAGGGDAEHGDCYLHFYRLA